MKEFPELESSKKLTPLEYDVLQTKWSRLHDEILEGKKTEEAILLEITALKIPACRKEEFEKRLKNMIFSAARVGKLNILKSLLEKLPTFDVNSTYMGETVLIEGIKHLPIVNFLLERKGININFNVKGTTYYHSGTALHYACRKPPLNLEIIKKLIDAGADVNARILSEEATGATPLAQLSRLLKEDIEPSEREKAYRAIQYLLQNGANPNIPMEFPYYGIPIHHAIEAKDINGVKILVKVSRLEGWTFNLTKSPLEYAKRHANNRIVQMIENEMMKHALEEKAGSYIKPYFVLRGEFIEIFNNKNDELDQAFYELDFLLLKLLEIMVSNASEAINYMDDMRTSWQGLFKDPNIISSIKDIKLIKTNLYQLCQEMIIKIENDHARQSLFSGFTNSTLATKLKHFLARDEFKVLYKVALKEQIDNEFDLLLKEIELPEKWNFQFWGYMNSPSYSKESPKLEKSSPIHSEHPYDQAIKTLALGIKRLSKGVKNNQIDYGTAINLLYKYIESTLADVLASQADAIDSPADALQKFLNSEPLFIKPKILEEENELSTFDPSHKSGPT